jgi:large-conductance mechanosensitive channel
MNWAHFLASPAVGFVLYAIVVFLLVCEYKQATQGASADAATRDGPRSTRPKNEWPVLEMRVALFRPVPNRP